MSTRISLGYSALLAVLGAAVFVLPGLAGVLWAVIGLLTVAAILHGSWQHAPYSRAPWWLFAGAIAALAAGNSLLVLGGPGGTGGPGDQSGAGPAALGLADACHLCVFPLATLGLLLAARPGLVFTDRSEILDLLTFACAAVLACWVGMLRPAMTSAQTTTAERLLLAAYALGALLVLISTVRLASTARLSRSVAMLVAGGSVLPVAAMLHAMALLGGGSRPGHPAEAGYLLACAGWAGAAGHPSMAALIDPVTSWPSRLPARRSVLLAASLAVPSGLLLAGSAAGGIDDPVLIGTVWLVMLFLVIARLADATGRYRESLVRERALREACGTMLAAADAEQLGAAVRSAVTALLPATHPYEMVLAGTGRSPLPRMPAGRRSRLIDTGLLDPATTELLYGDRPHRDGPNGERPHRDGDPYPGAGPHEAALVCPLGLDGRPGSCGALVVAASRLDLLIARNAIEVLAAQAALALQRLSLMEAMNRQDGENYLRTVVRNSTDVVLVTEPSGQIRYASPSLATAVGVDPAALPTLHDLVDTADHGRLSETLGHADPEGVADVWTLRRPDGGRQTVEVSCRDLRHDPVVRGYLITLRDVTQRQQAEQEHIRQALEASPAGQNRQSSATKYRRGTPT